MLGHRYCSCYDWIPVYFSVFFEYHYGTDYSYCCFELVSAVGLRKKPYVSAAKCSICIGNSVDTKSDVLVHGHIFSVHHFMLGSTIYHYKKVKFKDISVVYGMTLLVTTALNTVSLMRYLKSTTLYAVCGNGVICCMDCRCGSIFFVGSFIGKHKLCPNISPKKTIEGAVGGFVINIGLIMLMGYLYNLIFMAHSFLFLIYLLQLLGGVTADFIYCWRFEFFNYQAQL